MEIAKIEKDGVIIIALNGRLDAASAPDAESELNTISNSEVKLLIDLENLEYISSAGLRVLLVTAKQIRRNSGKMCICSLSETVSEVFEISGFSSIFDIAENREEALDILNDQNRA